MGACAESYPLSNLSTHFLIQEVTSEAVNFLTEMRNVCWPWIFRREDVPQKRCPGKKTRPEVYQSYIPWYFKCTIRYPQRPDEGRSPKEKSDPGKVALMVLMVGMTEFEPATSCSRIQCAGSRCITIVYLPCLNVFCEYTLILTQYIFRLEKVEPRTLNVFSTMKSECGSLRKTISSRRLSWMLLTTISRTVFLTFL